MTESVLTISAAARSLGIPEGTLRRYTQEGIFPDQRDSANRRVFSLVDVESARGVISQRQQAARHGR